MPQIIVTYPILSRTGRKISKDIIVEFAIGDSVTLRTDKSNTERMVIGWHVTEQGVRYDIYPEPSDRESRFYYNIELELVEDL